MIRRFQGIQNLLLAWKDAIDSASASGRTATALRALQLPLELAAAVEQSTPKINLGRLSDAELERHRQQALEAVLAANPSFLEWAAASQGYSLVPCGTAHPEASTAEAV
jgi:hypothetical protein